MFHPRRRGVSLAAIALATIGCKNSSQDLEDVSITPSASYWKPDVSGDFDITAASIPGTATETRLDEDLGLDGDDQWTARVDVQAGKHRVGLEYLPLQLSGSTITEDDFIFHGATYPVGDHVRSDVGLTTWIARYDYQVWSTETTADSIRIGLDGWLWDFDARVKGSPSGNDEHRHFSHFYPGVHGELTFDASHGLTLTLFGSYATTSIDTRLWDVNGSLAYTIADKASISLGYRWITWDFNESSNDGDFDLRGPFVGLALHF